MRKVLIKNKTEVTKKKIIIIILMLIVVLVKIKI